MPKQRTKRQDIRDEKRRKRREKNLDNQEPSEEQHGEEVAETAAVDISADVEGEDQLQDRPSNGSSDAPVTFFGMLSDEEQEYFRSVDEQLDLDDFASQEDRDTYLANVFVEADGKELKLACSQSCSRLMERLILMSNTRQKKKLFSKFGGHFFHLVQHRFASHCCETLFVQSAPIVTRELGGDRDDLPAEGEEADDAAPLPSMEELFLLTLDELEGNLSFLITDQFGSHALRALLIILSGRPLAQFATKSLIHSKKKEKISVPWTSTEQDELNGQLRAVPGSFTLATKKIISDSTSTLDSTALRVMAKHPTGNPVLQLLLELDISLNSKADDETAEMTLLWRLLPNAPESLKNSTSTASDFISQCLYDPIGSRLLETLITNCPGKLFKVMYKHIFSERIASLVRNHIACYPAIRILNRLSKEDLAAATQKILKDFTKLMELSRFNVIKTLFERCVARGANPEMEELVKALVTACGGDAGALVPKLCFPPKDEKDTPSTQEPVAKNKQALVSHGSQLASTLLGLPGSPTRAVQTSLLALSPEQLSQLATSSAPTSHVLVTALTTPSKNKIFHKSLVAGLKPNTLDMANSEHGARVLSAIVSVPSKGEGISVPFHFKESIMMQLGQHEAELRETFQGRKVWRAWRGDLWKTRRTDWIAWAKEVDTASEKDTPIWQKRHGILRGGQDGKGKEADKGAKRKRGAFEASSANLVKLGEGRFKRKKDE